MIMVVVGCPGAGLPMNGWFIVFMCVGEKKTKNQENEKQISIIAGEIVFFLQTFNTICHIFIIFSIEFCQYSNCSCLFYSLFLYFFSLLDSSKLKNHANKFHERGDRNVRCMRTLRSNNQSIVYTNSNEKFGLSFQFD